VLTLSERVEAIKLHDGGKSSRDVAQIMGVGRMQIQQIIKRKSEVLDNYESNDQEIEVLISSNLTVLIINMNSTYRLICSLSQK
jgi:IS30 family transposase